MKPEEVFSNQPEGEPGSQPKGSESDSNLAPKQVAASESDAPKPASQPTAPAAKSGGNKRKWWIVGIVVAVLLLLLSGGAAATYRHFANSQPENVLKRALANSLDVNKAGTAVFHGALSVDQVSSGDKFEATYEGAVNGQSGAFSLSAKGELLSVPMTLNLLGVGNNSLYVKVDGLEEVAKNSIGAGGQAEGELASLEDLYATWAVSLDSQWIELSAQSFEQLSGESLPVAQPFDEADLSKLANAYNRNEFLQVKEVLPEEEIRGAASYRYLVELNQDKLKGFVAALRSANIEGLPISQEQIDEANLMIDQLNADSLTFEVWVDKERTMINQVEAKYNDAEVRAQLLLTVDSYGQPVEIHAPQNPRTIMDVLSEAFQDAGSFN